MSLQIEFADAGAIRRDLAPLCAPTKLTPVEAADKNLWISDGASTTKFLISQVPYMSEPLDCLSRRIYEAVIVVGPARSGKTKAMVEGWVNYSVTQAPGDMLILYSTKTKATKMGKVDLDRSFKKTKTINNLRSTKKSDNNITFVRFKNNMVLYLDSATEDTLSATTLRYAGATDYDRSEDGVGDEGNKFELMLMRVQNAKSSGMVMAESSPGRIVRQPKRENELLPHEGQPCGGIVSLYNEGDRRRFYWRCPDCEAWFQPTWETMRWDDVADHMAASKTARCHCPRCDHPIRESQKRSLNLTGRWFAEGAIDEFGMEVKDVSLHRKSKWATFWFEGIVATYASWENLVYRYLAANETYEKTGDEEKLKSFINTRLGRPYILQSHSQDIGAHELQQRAEANPYPRSVIPIGGRFLIMTIDVQGGKKNPRFVVQAQVYGEGLQRWVIDRFEILTKPNGDRINPAVYAEDWDLLIEQVMKKAYPLADNSGRVMKPLLTLCDSGGSGEIHNNKATSVTELSYQFYNRLKGQGLSHLFRLVKGASREMDNLVKESFPDKRSKHAHGEIPLLLLHTNRLKNRVSASYERAEFGSRYFWLPSWAERTWFEELTAEFVDEKGNWQKPERVANESFDLCAYAEAGMHYKGGDDINWQAPPSWAAEWQFNSNVVDADQQPVYERKPKARYKHSRGIYG